MLHVPWGLREGFVYAWGKNLEVWDLLVEPFMGLRYLVVHRYLNVPNGFMFFLSYWFGDSGGSLHVYMVPFSRKLHHLIIVGLCLECRLTRLVI